MEGNKQTKNQGAIHTGTTHLQFYLRVNSVCPYVILGGDFKFLLCITKKPGILFSALEGKFLEWIQQQGIANYIFFWEKG